MTQRPDSWREVSLSELGKWVTGSTPKSSNPLNFGNDIDFVTPSDIDYGGLLGVSERRISHLGASSVRLVKAPSVNLVCIGTIGKVSLANRDVTTNQQINSLEVDELVVNPKFAMWLLASPEVQEKFWANASSTTVAILNKGNLEKIKTYIPPLPEQHKIVELLEDHLSRLNTGLADVRSAKSKSSQLKFAILSKVFSGEFFEFDMPILPLQELAKVMNGDRGKNYPNKSARVISGIPFINAGHLDNDLLNVEDMDFISEERYKLLAAGKVELNDLLFCLRGSLGKVAINDKFIEGAIASSLAILRVNSKVLPKYLYYYFLSPLAAIEIKKHDNGTAQPNLSAANLRQFEVPTPPIEQQKIVIDFLDSELSRTIQASQTFDSLFSTASAMRRSLLQAAFTGQLTKEVASV